jgi:hypothetical protein
MTGAVNMSRDDQQGKQNSKHRLQWGGGSTMDIRIRDVRSAPWQVKMLEVKKGIQDVPFCLVG